MIRRLAACSAAVLVALAAPSSGAASQISDPQGDWAIPSQDILSGGLSTDASGRLVATLRLAAPLGDLPGSYHVVFYRGDCDSYVATFDYRGSLLPGTSALEVSQWCPRGDLAPGIQDPRPAPVTTLPAPVTVAGDTISWTLPALPDFGAGQRLRAVGLAAPNPEALLGVGWADSNGNSGEAYAYDIAYGQGEYVVGTR